MSTLAYRLAVGTGAATFVLILAGGLVTNTGSALAVPDWPTTFGHNMFLFPWADMIGGIFFEHSHRLLGAVVGLLTLALGTALWPLGGRYRALGLVAIGAVVVQGVLGGLRVVLLADTLAIVHGCLAQAFFALVVAIAVLVKSGTRSRGPSRSATAWPGCSERWGVWGAITGASARPSGPPMLSIAAAALVYVQIVFGALLTHGGHLHLHLAGAVLVFTFVPIVTARLRRAGAVTLARWSRGLLALLGLQLLLGAASYLARFSAIWIPGGQTTILVLPVAHRLVASLILATAVGLALRVTLAGRVTDVRQSVSATKDFAGATAS
jgi:cytochrome c oxidase assembly protein subunit 15